MLDTSQLWGTVGDFLCGIQNFAQRLKSFFVHYNLKSTTITSSKRNTFASFGGVHRTLIPQPMDQHGHII